MNYLAKKKIWEQTYGQLLYTRVQAVNRLIHHPANRNAVRRDLDCLCYIKKYF
jgi:hypothetical protein